VIIMNLTPVFGCEATVSSVLGDGRAHRFTAGVGSDKGNLRRSSLYLLSCLFYFPNA
jgi:hypothetical protein